MKQEDAFTSCNVVDGPGSLPYVIKKDVKQYLLKLNNVQIRSLNNTYPWVLKGYAEILPWIANIILNKPLKNWDIPKKKNCQRRPNIWTRIKETGHRPLEQLFSIQQKEWLIWNFINKELEAKNLINVNQLV